MSYWNPIERYGVERFAADLAAAGGAGAITPDLIPDEAGAWLAAAERRRPRPGLPGRAVVHRRPAARRPPPPAAASSTPPRPWASPAPGPRSATPPRRWSPAPGRSRRDLPVCVGLGVSNGAQAAEVAAFADGVIVGSAFVRGCWRAAAPTGVRALSAELAEGVRRAGRAAHDRARLHPAARPRASGTSARCRSAPTRSASSPGIVAAILAHRAALGRPRRRARRRARHRRLGGAVRHRRRPALPRDHQPAGLLRRAAATRCGPSPSGRAASASGARSPSAGSAPGSPAGAAASRCRPSPTRSPPGCWSPRRSAGSATGSTTSSTAARPTCRGR